MAHGMRILTLDAALGACSAGVVEDGVLGAHATRAVAQGQAGALAAMAASVLGRAPAGAAGSDGGPGAVSFPELDAVAVTVGPGSFTGIRAALALAHGIALACAIPVIGVSVGEALAATLTLPDGWTLWSAIDSRRGRVFLERAHAAAALTPRSGAAAPTTSPSGVLSAGHALFRDRGA